MVTGRAAKDINTAQDAAWDFGAWVCPEIDMFAASGRDFKIRVPDDAPD